MTIYTEEVVEYIIKSYETNPCRETVNALAEEYEVSPRSVIGKLSKLGVYRRNDYTPKYADKPISKEEIVSHLAHELDIDLDRLSGLSKAQKPPLLLLIDRLVELKIIEDIGKETNG